MNKTLLRSLASLAIVLVAYTAYALVAVPLIEPQLSLPETTARPNRSTFDGLSLIHI